MFLIEENLAFTRQTSTSSPLPTAYLIAYSTLSVGGTIWNGDKNLEDRSVKVGVILGLAGLAGHSRDGYLALPSRFRREARITGLATARVCGKD